MHLSRIVIRNFRNFRHLDLTIRDKVTCVVGENNTGKSNLVHAIRLAVDATLSSAYRVLLPEDFAAGIDPAVAEQILVSLEYRGFAHKPHEEGLLANCAFADDVARITYRFRPKRDVREAIAAGTNPGTGLTLEDYRWEIMGGGGSDPATAQWNDDFGTWVRFEELQQSYLVVLMEPLRDVEQRLRQARMSPLAKLLTTADIPPDEQDALVALLARANEQIAASSTIAAVGTTIKTSFDATAGSAFTMGVSLGMSAPTFGDVSRSLNVLLSNSAMTNFEPSRNGLGLNNILYISMLLAYFARRVSEAKTAGQLLVIEEPEAHLHPQLQRVLYSSLIGTKAQTLITTHSTHITSQAPLSSLLVLTNDGTPATVSTVPAHSSGLELHEIADLERYLDATRSTLLFARKVLLVEGPAELFLIPPLIEHVMGIDLDAHGITVVPIHGTHFEAYAKLFGPSSIAKKCAIVTDGDAQNEAAEDEEEEDDAEADEESEASVGIGAEDAAEPTPAERRRAALNGLRNPFVELFMCETTFELELTSRETLPMFARAAVEVGAPRIASKLQRLHDRINTFAPLTASQLAELEAAKQSVLRTANRFGKARFAQIASKHVYLVTGIPQYLRDAINWLTHD